MSQEYVHMPVKYLPSIGWNFGKEIGDKYVYGRLYFNLQFEDTYWPLAFELDISNAGVKHLG